MKNHFLPSILFCLATTAFAQNGDLVFTTVTPCVVFDTRSSFGGPGPFAPEQERSFHIVGSSSNFAAQGGNPGGCGIPGFSDDQPVVQAVFINYIAINAQGPGQVKAWAGDETEPAQGSMVNYQALTPPLNKANGVVTEVRQDSEGGDIKIKAKVSGVEVRGVVLGYFTRDHKHSADDFSGMITEPFFDPLVTRDDEIPAALQATDGSGSNLDADALDGQEPAAFATPGHSHGVLGQQSYK